MDFLAPAGRAMRYCGPVGDRVGVGSGATAGKKPGPGGAGTTSPLAGPRLLGHWDGANQPREGLGKEAGEFVAVLSRQAEPVATVPRQGAEEFGPGLRGLAEPSMAEGQKIVVIGVEAPPPRRRLSWNSPMASR